MQPSSTSIVFDFDALQAAESDLRDRLLMQPDNLYLRLNLAWCLFMQALHQAGVEAAVHNTRVDSTPEPLPGGEPPGRPQGERTAYALLQNCLEQNNLVRHLTDSAEDRQSAERLQALVELSGAQTAATDAEAEFKRRLARLAREVRSLDI